jgi:hypothetical protein
MTALEAFECFADVRNEGAKRQRFHANPGLGSFSSELR